MSKPGKKATMQSTESASMMFLGMSPSPDWFVESVLLALRKPAVPLRGQVLQEVLNPVGLHPR